MIIIAIFAVIIITIKIIKHEEDVEHLGGLNLSKIRLDADEDRE